jgi:hypothetical protein
VALGLGHQLPVAGPEGVAVLSEERPLDALAPAWSDVVEQGIALPARGGGEQNEQEGEAGGVPYGASPPD